MQKKVKTVKLLISSITDRPAKLIINNLKEEKFVKNAIICEPDEAKYAADSINANSLNAKHAAKSIILGSEKIKSEANTASTNAIKAKRIIELIMAHASNANPENDEDEIPGKEADFIVRNLNEISCSTEIINSRIEKSRRLAQSIVKNIKLESPGYNSDNYIELLISDAEKTRYDAELIISNLKLVKSTAELVLIRIEKTKYEAEVFFKYNMFYCRNDEKYKNNSDAFADTLEKTKCSVFSIVKNITNARKAARSVISIKDTILSIERKKLTCELIKLNNRLSLANKHEKLSYEKYRELYNLAPSAYLTISREGRIIDSNLLAAKIFNKGNILLRDMLFATFISEDTKPDFNFFLQEIFKSKEKQICDVTLNIKDGLPLYVYLIGILSKNGDQCLLTINDITYHKQLEEALMKSEATHTSMISNISDVISIIDPDGKVKYISPNVTKWFDWLPSEIIGTDGWLTVHPEDLVRLKTEYSRLLFEIHSTTKVEFRIKCRDGNYKFVELNAINLLNNRNIEGILLNYHDITDRKLAENELIKQKHFFEQMFMQSSVSTQILDGNGWCERVNPKLSEIFCVEARNIEGKYNIFMDEAIKLGNGPDLDVVFSNGKAIEWEIFFDIGVAADSQKIDVKERKKSWFYNWAYPIYDVDGKINHVIIQHHDINDQKEREQELINAKEHAEESDRLKSAFLANMSHEIRTPMNGILGFAELLKEPNLTDEEQIDYVKTIQISGIRMLNTINNIVDISKIESGLMKVAISETNINERLKFLYNFFMPDAGSKGLQLFLHEGLKPHESIIRTDGEKIHSVLSNLIRNAIKFSDSGSIEFGYIKKDGNLEFFVKDTGIGIPENQKEMIFKRFIQGNKSHNQPYEGSGLGLSISKSYVEMLDGKIWVESDESIGSVFYFTIPYKVVPEKITSLSKNIVEKNYETHQKYKILVAEDDDISFLLLKLSLRKIYEEIIHAKSGTEAIENCFKRPDLDLILMDIRMPDIEGYEATRQIRTFNNNVIIIAQTANAFFGDREKALAAGCNDYISKPVKINELNELIRKHLPKNTD